MNGASILFFVLLSLAAVAQFPSGRVLHYTRKDGLSYAAVNSIIQDNKGFIWLDTGDGIN
jgi:ligand-binding sensor domain-containing protein